MLLAYAYCSRVEEYGRIGCFDCLSKCLSESEADWRRRVRTNEAITEDLKASKYQKGNYVVLTMI